MFGAKYIGPVFDGSGYAEAARQYVLSIHKQGYPITLSPITFEKTRPALGASGEILESLVNNPIQYDKVIVHSTPDLWATFTQHEQGKRIIGYTVWETDRLHPTWVAACNRVSEVWVPCDWNMEVFANSGVTRPLYKVPHTIQVPDPATVGDFALNGVDPNAFVFYSIFQWQERKNPYGLLTSFCSSFSEQDNVVLVLKTYRHDQAGDKDAVKKLVLDYRKYVTLDSYPRMFLVVENMSTEDMWALHKRGDCFVLLQRSEGWGLPHFEAAAMGKPIITPGYGGQTEFLKEDNSYLTNYTETPVTGMPWSPYYRADQFWAEPDLKDAIRLMRHVYTNQDEAREKGRRAREYVQENFTIDRIGTQIVSRLRAIDQGGFNA